MNIIDSCDSAFRAYLVTAPNQAIGLGQESGGVAVFTGKDSEVKALPCIICAADGASVDEDPKGTGNYWLDVTTIVKSVGAPDLDQDGNVIDPTAGNIALVNQVFSLLQLDPELLGSLDQVVNAAAAAANIPFFIFPTAYILASPRRGQDEQGVWWDEQPMRIYCCGKVLTP